MKPRTKIQKEIVSLSNKLFYLKGLSAETNNWIEALIKYPGCVTKKGVITCLNCNHKYKLKQANKKYSICPNCSKAIELHRQRVQQMTDEFFVSEMLTINEWQVVRTILVSAFFNPKGDNLIGKVELNRVFINKELDTHAISVSTLMSGYPAFGTPLEYRHRIFTPRIRGIYPKSNILHPFKKRGFKPSVLNSSSYELIHPINTIRLLMEEPKVETLLKSGYNRMYAELTARSFYGWGDGLDEIRRFWPSIRIAIRNRYHAYNWRVWFDHLELLNTQHKDLRNPYYICPRYLKNEHQNLIEKQRILDARAEERRKQRQILEDKQIEKDFLKKKSKFFDILIKNGPIEISPLKSLSDFKEESDALHHCVFGSKYYERDNSLIFSARVKGKRTETIEFDLLNKEVVQCRGMQNEHSKYHKPILGLFNKHINDILTTLKV